MSDPRIKPRVPRVNWENPLSRGLVNAWPYSTGGTVVQDLMGPAGDGGINSQGTVAGGSYTYPTIGRNGRQVSQVLSYSYHGDQPSMTDGDTISMVFHTPLSYPGSKLIFGQNNNNYPSTRQIALIRTTSSTAWFLNRVHQGTGSGPWIGRSTGSIMLTDTHYHVVSVWRGTDSNASIETWVNGVRLDTGNDNSGSFARASMASSAKLWLGSQGYNNNAQGLVVNDVEFTGDLIDIRRWSRGLAVSEIAELYSDPWALYRTPEPVLAGTPATGFFEFDQLTGGMPDLRGGMV